MAIAVPLPRAGGTTERHRVLQRLADSARSFHQETKTLKCYGVHHIIEVRLTLACLLQDDGGSLMSELLLERAFSETKTPSVDAIEVIRAHSKALVAKWRQQLRNRELSREEIEFLTALDPEELLHGFPRMTFGSFRQRLVRLGRQLASREVRITCILEAFGLLLDLCIHQLNADSADPKRASLAATRLWRITVILVVSGYSKRWETNRHVLQTRLNEAEHRLHGASAYVTNVYERERRRLSQDLHDDIGHQLLLLKLYLELVAAEADKEKNRHLKQKLDEALILASSAIESVRRLVLDLGPAIFDELGFVAALKFCARQFSVRTGIKVSLQENQTPEVVPQSHQVALYRILQGALSNVLKHAKAQNVKVALGTAKRGTLVMSIEDDGVGFDVMSVSPRSYGLTAMRERTEVLEGKLRIESNQAGSPGRWHGTRIEIELPLPVTETK